jgi:2,4-dienoyl-CoA reductase-like NADH-dependent reductase (Old Yellow Enzyme family)
MIRNIKGTLIRRLGRMILNDIERYLRHTKTTPTRFGREAVGDPNFVQNLRDGREPRRRTVARVASYLDRRERERLQAEGG